MYNGYWLILGVVNSLNGLCFAMFLETSASLSLSRLLIESIKIGRFSSRLFAFLFGLVVLSSYGSKTSSPVREDIGVNQFTIKRKLNKNFPSNGAKILLIVETTKI
jgi:hypothetical protein